MKKLVVGLLVIIPVLVLVVTALTSMYVSTLSHIAVTSLTIDKTDLELDVSDTVYDANKLLVTTITPALATDKTVSWRIEGLECTDDEYVARYLAAVEAGDINAQPAVTMVDANGNAVSANVTGKFKINSYGSFLLVAQTETKSASCLVSVGSADIKTISLTLNGSNSTTMTVGESARLHYSYLSSDAIVNSAVWTSSNEKVLKVSGDGVIEAKSIGLCFVRLSGSVYSSEGDNVKYVESNAFTVNVTSAVADKGNTLFVERNCTLSELGVDGFISASGAKVTGDNVVFDEDAVSAQIVTQNGTLNLQKCAENDIEIEYKSIYQKSSGYVFDVKGQDVQLRAKWRSTLKSGTPNVTWSISSSTEGIATIAADGTLDALKNGTATVTATLVGDTATDEIEIETHEKIASVLLYNTTSSYKVGIAKQTVFGASVITSLAEPKTADNFMTVEFSRPVAPSDPDEYAAFIDQFEFSVDKSDKAYFVGNKLYFNAANITEMTTLNVTVKAKYPKFESKESYTTKTFAIDVTSAVEVDTFAEFKRAMECSMSVSMMADIAATESVWAHGSIYGNNHRYYGKNMFEIGGDRNMTPMIFMYGDSVVSNAHFSCYEETPSAIVGNNDASGTAGLVGCCISFDAADYSKVYTDRDQVRVEYCVLENCATVLKFFRVDGVVDGCIMQNTSECALYAACEGQGNEFVDTDGFRKKEWYSYSNVTVNNSVMSCMAGTGMSFAYQDNFYWYNTNTNSWTDENGEYYYDHEHNGSFTQTGFLDIYNWQNLDGLQLIPPTALGEDMQGVVQFVNSQAATVLAAPEFDVFRMKKNNENYFHLGLMSTGIMSPTNLDYSFEDTRFKVLDTSKSEEIKSNGLIGALLGIRRYFFIYDNTSDITPDNNDYTLNLALINRLNGNR